MDDTKVYYLTSDDKDWEALYDLFGENTSYIIDPEEIMAVNFSNVPIYGRDGVEGKPYKSPRIVDQIIDYLKK